MSNFSGAVLSAINLRKSYETPSGDLEILRGVNMEVRSGEMLFVTGRSGSGLFGALLFVAIIAVGAKTLWPKLHPSPVQPVLTSNSEQPATEALNSYRCDGRQYCSQMRSCDEAKYFLKHCPDVKMDGNHDGVPCEAQWCGN